MGLLKRKRNKPPYKAKITAYTYPSTLEKFKRTARRLEITQADLLTEALKDIIQKHK